jgi:nitroimidazol reductase NimA-like FMN-containing flavoprotein (pyridoxamine 5'-phosphate oxidase superfamily)
MGDVGLNALPEAECWKLLRSHDLGRIAIVVEGKPEIFPVNYAAGDGAIVFRTAPGMKLAQGPGTIAAFEIDGLDEPTNTGWSVVLQGSVREITGEPGEAADSLRRRRIHPAAPGAREHVLALFAERVTGRRFSGGPMAPGVHRRP